MGKKTVKQQIDESNELVSEGEKVYKNEDVNKAQDGFCKTLSEIRLAVQEWGIKNNLRLFGVYIDEWEDPRDCDKTILIERPFLLTLALRA